MAISRQDLRRIARARLDDAEALLAAGRFDGSVYLGGYAVELAIKARICRQLRWPEFPESGKEFQDLQSLKTHNLDALIRFSGVEPRVKASFLAEWSIVQTWNPELRYRLIGGATRRDAEDMVAAVKTLLGIIR